MPNIKNGDEREHFRAMAAARGERRHWAILGHADGQPVLDFGTWELGPTPEVRRAARRELATMRPKDGSNTFTRAETERAFLLVGVCGGLCGPE